MRGSPTRLIRLRLVEDVVESHTTLDKLGTGLTQAVLDQALQRRRLLDHSIEVLDPGMRHLSPHVARWANVPSLHQVRDLRQAEADVLRVSDDREPLQD